MKRLGAFHHATRLAVALALPAAVLAQPTTGPLMALGLTNTPIGDATLEIIDGGILFVGNVEGESVAGVSVALGEADSGVFLYPLTGYLYGGETMEARAYGRVNGVADQFISSVHGIHNGDGTGSGTVTVDFTPLGATRLSVFVGGTLLGRITNSTAEVWVQGNGYGCRANPWWRLPDGSTGALIELAQDGNNITLSTVTAEPIVTGRCLFIRPDDLTNSVEFVSRVDVTSSGLGSFCLTDARLGVFHQRHKALGQATLHPAGGQLVVGNLVSNVQDGVAVELASVSAFAVHLQPIELTGTNTTILVSGYGTSGGSLGTALGTVRIDNRNGFVQIGTEMGVAPQTTEILVLSNGVVVGSNTVLSGAAIVNLSDNPRIIGCALLAKTTETLPGIAARVDRMTTFTNSSDGVTFEGDEVRMLAVEPVQFESLESFVIVVNEIPSFTITGESEFVAPAPALNIARSGNGVTVSWPDPNRVYFLESAASLSGDFLQVADEPAFTNNYCRTTLSIGENSRQFFRLQRHVPADD